MNASTNVNADADVAAPPPPPPSPPPPAPPQPRICFFLQTGYDESPVLVLDKEAFVRAFTPLVGQWIAVRKSNSIQAQVLMTQLRAVMWRHHIVAFDIAMSRTRHDVIILYFTRLGYARYRPHVANTDGYRTCGGCGLAAEATVMPQCSCEMERYCSVECQRRDWANHKTLCRLTQHS